MQNYNKSSKFGRHLNYVKNRKFDFISKEFIDSVLNELNLQYRQRIFTPYVTIIMFLFQIFNEDGSCIFAVTCLISSQISKKAKRCALNTGSFCKAKARLPLEFFQSLARKMGKELETTHGNEWQWKHGNVKIVDGTGFSMPETKSNLSIFPKQNGGHLKVGFPVGRIVAVFSLATGGLVDLTIAPWKGKKTGELSLLQKLWSCFSKGDTFLADSMYSNFWTIAQARSKGIHIVAELKRSSYYRLKKRKNDQYIWLEKAKHKSLVITQQESEKLPNKIKVRIIKIRCAPKGFRPKVKYILTTHLDNQSILGSEIAELYQRRWQIEVNLRHLKTTLGMDILKGKSPNMVEKEIWTHVLAYNIIRIQMAKAGVLSEVGPDLISFHLTQQIISIKYMIYFFSDLEKSNLNRISFLTTELLVNNRPNRFEPRAIKRRQKSFALLSEPRKDAKRKLHKKLKGKSPC